MSVAPTVVLEAMVRQNKEDENNEAKNNNNSDIDDMDWRSVVLAGVRVSLSEPRRIHVGQGKSAGVTFLLTGAMIPERQYTSTRRILVEECNHTVIGLYINVLTTKHQWVADQLPRIYRAYAEEQRQKHEQDQNKDKDQNNHLYSGFNVVGHSVGGKICLLVATAARQQLLQQPSSREEPPESSSCVVRTILALDPVDLNPSVFTSSEHQQAIPTLHASKVIMTWATATSAWSLPPQHNAKAIYEALTQSSCDDDNKNIDEKSNSGTNHDQDCLQPLICHEGASHMAYTDHWGSSKNGTMGWWVSQCIMPGGNEEANRAALQNVHKLIRRHFSPRQKDDVVNVTERTTK